MPSASAETTLLVTNDYPPRLGGIETFVSAVTEMLDHDVVVLTSRHPGAERVRVPHPVHRAPTPVLLPTPATTRYAVEVLRRTGATRVLFGAAAPLALMAGRLRRAGAERVVALTHGHEASWARVPAARQTLRRIGAQVDHLCYISEHTRRAIAPALDPTAAGALVRLP
uniref:glycosyltransferase n=1 Tax=Desertihabitans aurantiacus TaxID=2282477 RepID=UPI0013007FAC